MDDELEKNEDKTTKIIIEDDKKKNKKDVEDEDDSDSESEEEDDDKKKKKKKKKKSKRTSHSYCAIPGYHRFKQQTLAYRIIIMTPYPFVLCLVFLAICCLVIGAAFVASTALVKETPTYRYDNLCPMGSKCTFRFEVEEDMPSPVYFYYRLEYYYQNHRRYKNSVSYKQLRGVNPNDYDSLSSCDPKRTPKSSQKSTEDVYLPCGLQAISYFNDTFVLLHENGLRVDQSSKHVSWSSDEVLFKDPGKDTKGIRVVDSFENPNFKVWMKIAALPNFLKLYSIINEDLKKGVYKIEITNWYPIHDMDQTTKHFKLTTTEWNGGKNYILGVALLIVGVILVIMAVFVCLKEILYPRQLGNIAYLEWTR